jgi:hypothetical protein
MIWFLSICLIGFLIFYFPAFRRYSLYAIGGICVLGFAIYSYDNHKQAVAKSLISAGQLALNKVILTSNYGYDISGEVQISLDIPFRTRPLRLQRSTVLVS